MPATPTTGPRARGRYGDDYYGAFLRDPDGNSIEAVHHDALRRGEGIIDHLWIRVADLAAATSFYSIVAAAAGFDLRTKGPSGRPSAARRGDRSHSSPGPATENLHMAFPGDDDGVRRFYDVPSPPGIAATASPVSGPRTTRLLRRLRPRSRWQQHRGGQPPPALSQSGAPGARRSARRPRARGGWCWLVGDGRHDRRVRDMQVPEAVNASGRVDHRPAVAGTAHGAGPDRVEIGRHRSGAVAPQLVCGRRGDLGCSWCSTCPGPARDPISWRHSSRPSRIAVMSRSEPRYCGVRAGSCSGSLERSVTAPVHSGRRSAAFSPRTCSCAPESRRRPPRSARPSGGGPRLRRRPGSCVPARSPG